MDHWGGRGGDLKGKKKEKRPASPAVQGGSNVMAGKAKKSRKRRSEFSPSVGGKEIGKGAARKKKSGHGGGGRGKERPKRKRKFAKKKGELAVHFQKRTRRGLPE